MVTYSATRKIKTFKVKVTLLSLTIALGLIYNAVAQTPATPAKPTNTPSPEKAVAAPEPAAPVKAEPVVKKAKAAPVDLEKVSTPERSPKRSIVIEQYSAEIMKFEAGVSEIYVANPEIADVALQATGVAYIYGKKPGTTYIYASGKSGKNLLNMAVQVTYNLDPIKNAIARSYPAEDVEVISTPSGIILEGEVSSPKASKDIVNIVTRYVAGDDAVINNMGISSSTQVYLQVKVCEVSRTVLKQLDINWSAASNDGASNFAFGLLSGRNPTYNTAATAFGAVAGTAFESLNAPGATVPNTNGLSSLGIRAVRTPTLDVSALLDAVSKEGLATVLAEPNLIALSGETAKVLVGGEVPYTIPQGSGTVSIEFKQYGISLDFTPTILSSNRINLRVRPEVSEIDRTSGINIGGISVPGFKTRRAETSVEIGSGDSLAIAGLFQRKQDSQITGIPGFQDIPVLGALFRSTQYQRNESELVIIVTPILVDPIRKRSLVMPNKGLEHASHLTMILANRLNRVVTEPEPGEQFIVTQDLADTGESENQDSTSFEQSLASTTETPSATVTEQVVTADTSALKGAETSIPVSDVTLVGDTGFYTR